MIDPLAMIDIFRVQVGETPYSRLNPLTKFLMFAVFVALPLISSSLLIQIFSLLSQIPLILLSKSENRIKRSLKASLIFIMLLIILNYITTRSLDFSLAMVLRLVSMIIASAIFMAGTSPAEIGDLLTKLKVPLQITFSFIIALRFIPVLADDVVMIVTSQASRGYEVERGGFFERIKKMIPILIPMIIIAIRRGHQLAEALETKAFGALGKRSSYAIYEYGWQDAIIVLYSIFIVIVGILISLQAPFQLLPFHL